MIRYEHRSANTVPNEPQSHPIDPKPICPLLISADSGDALDILQRTVAAAASGLVIARAGNGDNPIIYCNPAFCRLTGFAEDEVLGKDCRFLQGPHTDPAAVEDIRRALGTGRGCRTILRNYKKNGCSFWNELLISPMRDQSGKLTHWVGVQTDVSDLKETQAALAASNEKVINILESMTDAFFSLDREWRFTYVNPQAEPFLQMRRDDLLGKVFWDIFPASIGSRFFKEYHRAMGEHVPVGFADYDRRLDTWFEVRAYP